MVVKVDKSQEFVKSGKILISEYPKIHENTKIIQNLQSSNQKPKKILYPPIRKSYNIHTFG